MLASLTIRKEIDDSNHNCCFWDLWLERLLGLLDLAEHQVPVFYVSEEEYAQELQNRGYQAHFSPRKFGISATFIRENPEKYRDYIAPAFVDFFISKNF